MYVVVAAYDNLLRSLDAVHTIVSCDFCPFWQSHLTRNQKAITHPNLSSSRVITLRAGPECELAQCRSVQARGQRTARGIADEGKTHNNGCIRYDLEGCYYDYAELYATVRGWGRPDRYVVK